MNQVVLCGRLVADPRVHVKADGLYVSEVRLVTNDRQEPEYHDVVTYRRLAELSGGTPRRAARARSRGICTPVAGRPRTAGSATGRAGTGGPSPSCARPARR